MRDHKEIEKEYLDKFKKTLNHALRFKIVREIGPLSLGGSYTPDDYLIVDIGGQERPMVVEVKAQVNHFRQLKSFTDFAKDFEGASFLVAEWISDPIKRQLKDMNLGFFEVGKEIYFPLHLTLHAIPGAAPSAPLTTQTGFRSDATLKLLFYFVTSPASLALPQRALSEKLDISLGAVNMALKQFEKWGAISTVDRSRRMLGDWDGILARWRFMYADSEKEKLVLGRFSPVEEEFYSNWTTTDLSKTQSYWGAEPAASLITHHLRPGFFTLYTYETRLVHFLKELRLRKDPQGKIEILRAFWPQELNDESQRTVPDFLVLCDLLNSGVDRNIETASLIERKIRQELP